jgi:hypothetical protein
MSSKLILKKHMSKYSLELLKRAQLVVYLLTYLPMDLSPSGRAANSAAT